MSKQAQKWIAPNESSIWRGSWVQRWGNHAKVLDTFLIKISKTQKPLKLFAISWSWPFHHNPYFLRVHYHLSFSNDVAKEWYKRRVELALHRDDVGVVVAVPVEHVSRSREKMRTSSRYTKTNWFSISQRTSLTRVWKTAGALVRPKGITRHS